MEKKSKSARQPRGEKAAAANAAKASDGKTKRGATSTAAQNASEDVEALKQENARLKGELEAAHARNSEIVAVTADVTKRLDAVIAAIRSIVKP